MVVAAESTLQFRGIAEEPEMVRPECGLGANNLSVALFTNPIPIGGSIATGAPRGLESGGRSALVRLDRQGGSGDDSGQGGRSRDPGVPGGAGGPPPREQEARNGTHLSRRARIVLELSKPRITRLVTLTAMVGFALAAAGLPADSWSWASMLVVCLGCVIGTALSSAGANALNQWLERRRDALMPRTATRPLPERRVSPFGAFAVGFALSLAGVGVLLVTCGAGPALVSIATILVYVLLYTPMKPVSPLSTLVGAVPGALPPLIGFSAAATLSPGAFNAMPGLRNVLASLQSLGTTSSLGGWSLFALMFVWQVPHVLALSWMYKDDYLRGGHKVLPVFDQTGVLTSVIVILWALLLIPATLLPAVFMPDRLGWPYVVIAGLSGGAFVAMCFRLARVRTRAAARAVFFGSIVHLPLLLLAMVVEVLTRLSIWGLPEAMSGAGS
jgi:protoheme IX farnesyltransferase